jgi:hypothetical protein
MTLQRTDAGVGQLTPGASRRSPEVFIPLRARDDDPAFWGWPDEFEQSESRPGKWDRHGVRMRLDDEVLRANWMVWTKADLRLRHAKLRDAGRVGDLIRIERVADPAEYDYQVFIVPAGSAEYDQYAALCGRALGGNSRKRYGYYDC